MADVNVFRIQTLTAKSLKYYQPVVRFTPDGMKNLGYMKMRHGRWAGITRNGLLCIRYFGTKTWHRFWPGFWEFDPDQTEERRGVR